jgi:hypothetical protein
MNSNFINSAFVDSKNSTRVVENQSFNLIINSLNFHTTSGNNNDLTYYFDWSLIPDIPYNVHMTYVGELNDLSTLAELPLVYINFGTSQSTYEVGKVTTNYSSQFVGFLRAERAVTSSFLYAEDNTNPPIFLSGRPINNLFTVKVFSNNIPRTLYNPTSGSLAEYVINLKFVPANLQE